MSSGRFPWFGWLGTILLVGMGTAVVLSQLATEFPWWRITMWTTPVMWWGYILLVDAVLASRGEESWFRDRPRLLVLQCGLSVTFWCLFEGYNRLIPGWQYLNLPEDLRVRFLAYAISFASIMPGMFITCRLLQHLGFLKAARIKPVRWSGGTLRVCKYLGCLFCVAPPLAPEPVRPYLWAFVWVGWFLWLEPFNYARGVPSLFRDWEQGDIARTLQLLCAGAICGLLWEFWNMWAYSKWIYIFPFGQSLKIFEMPVVGFLGFPPFAAEYFVMFHFTASFFTKEDKLGI